MNLVTVHDNFVLLVRGMTFIGKLMLKLIILCMKLWIIRDYPKRNDQIFQRKKLLNPFL